MTADQLQPVSIEHRGRHFRFYDEGEGAVAVLILHGIGNNKECMIPLVRYLCVDVRAIAIDLPGHNTIPMDDIRDMGGYVEYIRDFITFLDLEHVMLVGYSMGGLISIKYAELYPDDKRIRGVVAWVSPILGGDTGLTTMAQTFLHILDRTPKQLYRMLQCRPILRIVSVLLPFSLSKEEIHGYSIFPYESYTRIMSLILHDTYNIKTGVPLLCVFGTRDTIISRRNYRHALKQKCTNCIIEKVSHGGHFPQPKARDEVFAKIRIFIQKLSQVAPAAGHGYSNPPRTV